MARPIPKTKPTNLMLDIQVDRQLSDRRKLTGVSKSFMVNVAISEWLQRNPVRAAK